MRALVTGGAGFLGSHLVDRLVAAGHAVDVIDDLSTGSLGNLAAARADALRRGTELKVHTIDVRAPELAELVERRPPEVIYHLASRPGAARPAAEVTWTGAVNLLDAARRHGVGKVVVALDGRAFYGDVGVRDLPVKEGVAGAVRTLAGAAARGVVEVLAVHRARHDIEFTALAVADVFGPRQAGGPVVPLLVAAATERPAVLRGDGRGTRDLVFVDDAVDALVRAATRGSGLVVNVGTGVQTTDRDLHHLVCGLDAPDPEPGPWPADDVVRFALSPVRARIHLAWAPWTPLADGVEAMRPAAR